MKNGYFSFLFWQATAGLPWRGMLPLLVLTPALALAQQTIKGTVTDEKNAALPGVTVRLKDGSNAVGTGTDGTYSIKTTGPADVLVFSFVGTVTQEVIVGNQTTVNVTLLPDAQQLKDVVVIGYGTQSRQDVVGAVTSIKAEQFNPGVLTTPPNYCKARWRASTSPKAATPTSGPRWYCAGRALFAP
ncbi:carboxypeptidase-like regulatory domain-containing protein [Hymenobacter sp. BRD67]|uniref:carboxypeptidase-like regulatory domain-containing protein n=1 Tax=Hymenobacter sp. BRD67 TaxID=2675877 RepID=UPI001C2753FE|nr:carboxypeptidase-like regulatory domain-containing protein [Hymenobacter sp. BRD67]